MTTCRVSIEERENDCGETTPQQLTYLKQELIQRINANDDHVVVQQVIKDINDEMGEGPEYPNEEEATESCVNSYLDDHLCLVVDMVEGG